MRGVLAATLGVLSSAVVAITPVSNTTCARSLYILCARGSGEPAIAPKAGTYPDNTGSPGYLALQVAKQVQGTVIAGVIYPALDSTAMGAPSLTVYTSSENAGAKAIVEEVKQYHAACPNSKIALIGYSQGAQVIQDALCGGIGGNFNSDAPLSPDLVNKNIIAVALIADPTHIANTTYDHGTGVNDGIFSRKNTTVCNQYDSFTGSWCGKNDLYCDSGNNQTIHDLAPLTYAADVVQFVVEKWKNSTSQSDPEPTTTTTGSAATTGTSTTSSTSTPSGNTAASPGLALGQSLILGAGMVLAVWSLQ
ncbi:cutinase domain-containing protein [Trichoderma ceciliae]